MSIYLAEILNKLVDKYGEKYGKKRLPLELVRFYAVEMVKALSYMKSNKILHRDIKPENVMLDHHFHIKLADFGFGVKYDANKLGSEHNRVYRKCSNIKQKNTELKYQIAEK